jgi:ATP-binding cassette subfamily B protein
MALIGAVGKLMVPVVTQVVLDQGFPDSGFRAGFVYGACALVAVAVVGTMVLNRLTYIRLAKSAEMALKNLRVKTFAHIHRLSLAKHTANRMGQLTARVTSDVETLAQFASWGAISWIINSALIVGTLAVMLAYSWQLTLITVAVYVPIIPIMRAIQRRQLRAYAKVRERVGETLDVGSETVSGAAVVRAYGYTGRLRSRAQHAVHRQYKDQLSAHKYFAFLFPIADMFSALAMAIVVIVGVNNGLAWGISDGELIAFLFLLNLLLNPISELGEVLDQTQTALSGWAKILSVFDIDVEVAEPDEPIPVRRGPVDVTVDRVRFRYDTGDDVLHDVSLHIPAKTNVAVVGQTGSGKTTMAKLLCRLADPTVGEIRISDVPLHLMSRQDRVDHVRMVPQDGFLFGGTVADNVAMGHPGTTLAEVTASFDRLGLTWWVQRLPDGLDTQVGERGESLSVGERQLVALARAQVGNPGLLILDEATSSVDPETEQALAGALDRLAEGRTTISIAHRLSTAERADVVYVFDQGRIVESGHHDDLVASGGVYAGLYESWLGNTQI